MPAKLLGEPSRDDARSYVEASARELRDAIAGNLREARRLKGWSLRELASQSDVSKALVSRIERGEANPSLEILWKLIAALEIPFSGLVRSNRHEPQVVRLGSGRSFQTEDRAMEVSLLLASPDGNLEIYELSMPPKTESDWDSHARGTHEYAFVLEGTLAIRTLGQVFSLAAGDLIAFRGDADHTYRSGDKPLSILCLMQYGR